jgi:hypothetical protein
MTPVHPVINRLLASAEPSIRYRILVHVQGHDPASADLQAMQQAIKESARVQTLLAERDNDGRIPRHPYAKWDGAHWLLAALADLAYPAGDPSLLPLRDQVCEWLLGPGHLKGIQVINGRTRRCASQEGNALYYLLVLGLADERTDELARRLVQWQWPDGGWNCDKRPEATHASFMESLIPLRGLALHAHLMGNADSRAAAERAADIFLKRRLFRRADNGNIIHSEFVQLHYPCYWHYDILFGLKVMAEAGYIGDERCREALDRLVQKQLPDGGFPAEKKYYRVTDEGPSGRSRVDWGGTSQKQLNEFVTADALMVLKAAGRLSF